jgi:hypothetical protein
VSTRSQTRIDDDHRADRRDRWVDLDRLFTAHTSPAFHRLVLDAAGIDRPDLPLSLATLEKASHDSDENPLPPSLDILHAELDRGLERDNEKLALFSSDDLARVSPEVRDRLTSVEDDREFRHRAMQMIESGDVGEAGSDAIRDVMHRDHERRLNTLDLIRYGEESHARRLAQCMTKSVQLECPSMAGGCGSDDNYQPITCKSRLCPECVSSRIGKNIGRYKQVVSEWENPVHIRFGLDDRRENPHAALDELREVLRKFIRRKIPPSGEHQGKEWGWKSDGGSPADHYWKQSLCGSNFHTEARDWEREYVDKGRWIPVDEILPSRFYGIDQKCADDGSWNVHVHMLADCRYFPQAALSSVIEDCGGGPNVHIETIDESPGKTMESAIAETIAYATKAPEAGSREEKVKLVAEMKGAKLVQPSGECYGEIPDPDGVLLCSECERSPAWWTYIGVVDHPHDTMVLSTDGDRPPP